MYSVSVKTGDSETARQSSHVNVSFRMLKQCRKLSIAVLGSHWQIKSACDN